MEVTFNMKYDSENTEEKVPLRMKVLVSYSRGDVVTIKLENPPRTLQLSSVSLMRALKV